MSRHSDPAGSSPDPEHSPDGVPETQEPKDPADMANIKSQIKRNRQNEARRLRNKAVRSELKTRTKRALTSAEQGADDAGEQLRLAIKRIDTAAAKGVIHKNQAARRKSRLIANVSAAAN